jgi:hypothetical protein
MKDPEFFVYYDAGGDRRPRKSFGRDGRAAMEWATTHADRDPEVIKCQSVWSAREDSPEEKR